jgi:hypothetical protein
MNVMLRSAWFAIVLAVGVIMNPVASLAEDNDAGESSNGVYAPWVIDIRGGLFEPDLEFYKDFYGDSSELYLSGGFGYRFKDWLELDGEIGYFHDTGVGLQPGNNTQGGQVKYTLLPMHIFATFRGEFSEEQLFVPYGGLGFTTAYYEQKVESQGTKSGRTDLGYNLRGGLEMNLNRLDGRAASRKQPLKRSYLYLEVQYFTTEVDGIDLGGIAYLAGLRMEFKFGSDEPRKTNDWPMTVGAAR